MSDLPMSREEIRELATLVLFILSLDIQPKALEIKNLTVLTSDHHRAYSIIFRNQGVFSAINVYTEDGYIPSRGPHKKYFNEHRSDLGGRRYTRYGFNFPSDNISSNYLQNVIYLDPDDSETNTLFAHIFNRINEILDEQGRALQERNTAAHHKRGRTLLETLKDSIK